MYRRVFYTIRNRDSVMLSEFGIAAKELSNIASSSHFTICIESVENLMLISSDGYFWIIHIYLMLLESCW
ncbi:hypothetical protein Anas_12839 [Armadillidium nasatum]|uniref:Uncharacterized protein n=1 Tax=Armadillidium nasatum TaxID=96803 RepID=A0A5N5TFK5_9CRUS|nr:hypothetical protein Anas_12839 [Armadillidium nasatum]